MGINFMIFCICVLSSVSSIDFFEESEGVLRPADPLVEYGGSINLTCTLMSVNDNVTSSIIYFKYNPHRVILDHNIVILDEKSVVLMLRNVTWSTSKAHRIGCFYNYSGKPVEVDQQFFYVVARPKAVSDVSCIVYHKLYERTVMMCQWKNYNTDLWTFKTKFTWHQQHTDEKNCTDMKVSGEWSSCEWSIKMDASNRFIPSSGPMHLRFESLGIFPDSTPTVIEKTIEPTKLIQPDPIEINNITDVTNSTVTVLWGYPSGVHYIDAVDYKKLVYDYRVTAITNLFENKSVTVRNATKATITGLHPAEVYSIFIEIKPHIAGFWSNASSHKTITMKESAPSGPPIVALGSWFHSASDKYNKRTILVYWKDIERAKRNGLITKYHFRIEPDWSEDPGPAIVGSGILQKEIRGLDSSSAYTVYVQGENGAGLSSWATWPIPSVNPAAPKVPDNFTVEQLDTNTVEVNWANTGPPPDTVTMYWVCSSNAVKDLCQNHWQWKVLPGNSKSFRYNILNTKLLHYRFGLSVERGGVSSGMVQEEGSCVFPKGAVPAISPRNVKVDSIQHDRLSLTWDFPHCSKVKARVSAISIQYYKQPASLKNCKGYTGDVKSLRGRGTRFTLPSLTPATSYCLRVAAQSVAGTGNHSAFIPAMTLEEPPSIYIWIVIGSVFGGIVFIIIVVCVARYAKKGHHFWFKKKLFSTSMIPDIPMGTTVPRNESYTEGTEEYYANDSVVSFSPNSGSTTVLFKNDNNGKIPHIHRSRESIESADSGHSTYSGDNSERKQSSAISPADNPSCDFKSGKADHKEDNLKEAELTEGYCRVGFGDGLTLTVALPEKGLEDIITGYESEPSFEEEAEQDSDDVKKWSPDTTDKSFPSGSGDSTVGFVHAPDTTDILRTILSQQSKNKDIFAKLQKSDSNKSSPSHVSNEIDSYCKAVPVATSIYLPNDAYEIDSYVRAAADSPNRSDYIQHDISLNETGSYCKDFPTAFSFVPQNTDNPCCKGTPNNYISNGAETLDSAEYIPNEIGAYCKAYTDYVPNDTSSMDSYSDDAGEDTSIPYIDPSCISLPHNLLPVPAMNQIQQQEQANKQTSSDYSLNSVLPIQVVNKDTDLYSVVHMPHVTLNNNDEHFVLDKRDNDNNNYEHAKLPGTGLGSSNLPLFGSPTTTGKTECRERLSTSSDDYIHHATVPLLIVSKSNSFNNNNNTGIKDKSSDSSSGIEPVYHGDGYIEEKVTSL